MASDQSAARDSKLGGEPRLAGGDRDGGGRAGEPAAPMGSRPAVSAAIRPRRRTRCVYCGRPLKGKRTDLGSRLLACPAHRDLLARDPLYAEPDQWKAAR